MKKIKEVSNKAINRDIILSFIPFFITITIEIFFGLLNGGIISILNMNGMSLIFSIMIIYLIYGILIAITKKLSISTIIISVLSIMLLIINQIKIAYTGETIYISDINFLSNIDGIAKMIVAKDLLMLTKIYFFHIVALISVFCIIIRYTLRNDFILKNIKARIIILISAILVLVFLFIPNKNTKNIFLNIFLETEQGSYTTSVSYCDDYSLISGIYGILLNDRFYEPQNFNKKVLNMELNNTKNQETKLLGIPNIIVVFSESFWDIDKQDDVVFNRQVAPNIKRLKNEGKLIDTLSCTYGRLSENIAFELLTGGSLNYFQNGYIPIMSLYKKESSSQIPSILKELKKNNYKSKIVFGEDYYNSEKSMKRLGFDEYLDIEISGVTKTAQNRNNISDEYITNLIIKELENKNKGEKIFYMTETIQNHMPYKINKYTNYDIKIKQSNLESEMNDTILSYAQGIYEADKQLNRLYEYIKNYEEPTILIFLGDHLPYLYTESGKNALEYISYFNTQYEIENLYRKYNTQALILSNYNINIDTMPQYLSNNMLLTYIVNNMDIELSSYYKWLYSTMKYLPATNSYISLDKNGNKYFTQNLKGDMERINKLREHMQYKFFIKPIE